MIWVPIPIIDLNHIIPLHIHPRPCHHLMPTYSTEVITQITTTNTTMIGGTETIRHFQATLVTRHIIDLILIEVEITGIIIDQTINTIILEEMIVTKVINHIKTENEEMMTAKNIAATKNVKRTICHDHHNLPRIQDPGIESFQMFMNILIYFKDFFPPSQSTLLPHKDQPL